MTIKIISNKIRNIIFLNLIIIYLFNIFFFNISKKTEIKKITIQYTFLDKYKLKSNKINEYKNKKIPKISIISPIYNRKLYIKRFLKNMQYQKFQDFEILLIDDCSIDGTLEVIKDFYRKDNRIIIVKNKKRKGTFWGRNLGVLFAKGKYVILPDPDDIISKNIVGLCFKYAEKYNYDIIRFNSYSGKGIIMDNLIVNNIENKNFKQPELSTNILYLNNELVKTDHKIWNKFIKKDSYIIGLNSMAKFYLNINLAISQDQIINYIIYRYAKSFYFLSNIGYYYIRNNMSVTKHKFQLNKISIIFSFIYLKLIFEYSKNTKHEKDMANRLLADLFIYKKINGLIFLEKDNKFYRDIINKYLESDFITNNNKIELKKLIKI